MKTEALEEFLAVVKYGGISSASKKLYVTQPNLSNHIAKLEQELGFELFDRSEGSASLTRAGNAFMGYAQQALNLLNRGKSVGQSIVAAPLPLRFSTNGPKWFPPDAFLEENNLSIEFLDVSGWEASFDLLASGKIDFIFTPLSPLALTYAQERGSLSYKVIGKEQLAVAIGTQNPLALNKNLTVKDFETALIVDTVAQDYDLWSEVLGEIFSPQVKNRLITDPSLASDANAALWKLDSSIYICAEHAVRARFGNRDDVMIVEAIEGCELAYTEAIWYREKDAASDPRYSQILHLFDKEF